MMDQIRHGVARLHPVLLVPAILNACEAGTIYRTRAKPELVKLELMRLKALMPHTGCRKIADIFNRAFEEVWQMTVGIRKLYYEIVILRRQIKNAKPKQVSHNLIWVFDLTSKTTLGGQTRLVLGIGQRCL